MNKDAADIKIALTTREQMLMQKREILALMATEIYAARESSRGNIVDHKACVESALCIYAEVERRVKA